MDVVAVAALCASECVRQHVGLNRVADLINGFVYAMAHSDRLPDTADVLALAGLIEPDSRGQFRWTPVTFTQNNASGTAPSAVPGAVARLCSLLDADTDPIEWIRQFEHIHPFTDGDGRTGFVLYNWIAGSLDTPVALPSFNWAR